MTQQLRQNIIILYIIIFVCRETERLVEESELLEDAKRHLAYCLRSGWGHFGSMSSHQVNSELSATHFHAPTGGLAFISFTIHHKYTSNCLSRNSRWDLEKGKSPKGRRSLFRNSSRQAFPLNCNIFHFWKCNFPLNPNIRLGTR